MAIGPGSTGPEVRAHQERLRAAGFDPGPIDGIWGPKTQAATQAHHDSVHGGPVGVPGTSPVQPDMSAKGIIESTLNRYGLGTLSDWAWQRYLEGRPMEQIMIDVRNSKEYKARFAGMDALIAQGRAISEAEYISTESQMAELMHAYGLPPGFYDSGDDFADFIAKGVSPVELQRRLDLRSKVVYEMPQQTRDYLQSAYGIGAGGLLAWVTDPDKALPIIEKQIRTAEVAGLAERSGMRALSLTRAEELAGLPADEIQKRIDLYTAASYGATAEDKRELARLYGVTDITGWVTDPDRAIAVIQSQLQAAVTSGAAVRTGFGRLNQDQAERLAILGVDDQDFQAVTAAAQLFQDLPGGAEESAGGRSAAIDVLAGDQNARTSLADTAARRKAEFEGGGSFAQSQKGITGLKAPS